jgi:hypothetical protein
MPAIFAAPRSKTSIGILVFDGVTSDEHSLTITTTDQPIATGARVTDHAIVDPRVLKMTVVATRARGSAIPTDPLTDFNPVRHQQLYQQLLELARTRQLLRIVTSVDSYNSMLIVGVSLPRSSKADTDRLRITIMAKEIQTTEVEPVANVADAIADLAGPGDDLGAAGLEDTGEVVTP